MAQQNDLVFVTYTQAPKSAASTQAVRDVVRKQALKAYYSPQGSDRLEERQRESDALDKKSRKKHMNRFRIRRDEVQQEAKSQELVLPQKVYAFDPQISSLGPDSWSLVDYFRFCFKMKSMSIHEDKEWFNFTMTQSSISQATLCLVSLNRDLANGTSVSPTTLHHRAAAMKQLKQEIEANTDVDREFVAGTVALLAIAEDLEGNFTNSSAHFEGMAQVVKVCGGLRRFSGERSCKILKLIAWADLCHSAAWLSQPRLLGLFDDPLAMATANPSSRDVSSRMSDPIFRLDIERLLCPHLRGMIDLLHGFPRNALEDSSTGPDDSEMRRLIHMTEQLLSQLKGRIPFEGSVPAVARAFTSAAQLYVPAVIKKTPLPIDKMIELRGEVSKELLMYSLEADMSEGRSPRNLLLLWIQANLLVAAHDHDENHEKLRGSFQDTLEAMQIYSEEDLAEQLSAIAWSTPSIDDALLDLISARQLERLEIF